MQNLEVISVNLWQILISLINLTLIFLLVKRFLFKPVQKMLDARQAQVDEQYAAADRAQAEADANRDSWQRKMADADAQAQEIISTATARAQSRSDRLMGEAREKADGIVRQAQLQAQLEYSKAEAGIKREIVDVSTVLTEKILNREINPEDHRTMIESFIDGLGDDNG